MCPFPSLAITGNHPVSCMCVRRGIPFIRPRGVDGTLFLVLRGQGLLRSPSQWLECRVSSPSLAPSSDPTSPPCVLVGQAPCRRCHLTVWSVHTLLLHVCWWSVLELCSHWNHVCSFNLAVPHTIVAPTPHIRMTHLASRHLMISPISIRWIGLPRYRHLSIQDHPGYCVLWMGVVHPDANIYQHLVQILVHHPEAQEPSA